MKIISKTGSPDLAVVYAAKFRDDNRFIAEFVDAKNVDLPRREKWVVIVSTQFGCALNCLLCDAGGDFSGNLSEDEIFSQIDYVVLRRAANRKIKTKKFKVQFARMGEPALNPAVLSVLLKLPSRFESPGLVPCIATTAPKNCDQWFESLLEIKNKVYSKNIFQLQFSINSTDQKDRDRIMPFPKWTFSEISRFGEKFVSNGDRKIALNFALAQGVKVEPDVIKDNFDPQFFCVKLTPLNPTLRAKKERLTTAFLPSIPKPVQILAEKFKAFGFDPIISIGDLGENKIGSNCGMTAKTIKMGETC